MYFTFTYQSYRENGHIMGISTFAYNVAEQVLARQRVQELDATLHSSNVSVGQLAFLEAYQHLPQVQQQAVIIIMLTTSLHERDLTRAHELPISGFLSKPLTQEKVTDVLRQHFAQ